MPISVLEIFVGQSQASQTEADVGGYIVILYGNIRTIINPLGITLNHYRGPSLLLVGQASRESDRIIIQISHYRT